MNNGISPKAPAKEKIKSDFECLIRGMNGTGMIDCIAYDYLFDGAMPMFNKMYELGKKEATTWHPYPKEKPKEYDEYLVTVRVWDEDDYFEKVITLFYFDDEDRFAVEKDNYEVVAWAELPASYQPEKENEESL